MPQCVAILLWPVPSGRSDKETYPGALCGLIPNRPYNVFLLASTRTTALSLRGGACATIDTPVPDNLYFAEECSYAYGIRPRHQALLRSHRQRLSAVVQS